MNAADPRFIPAIFDGAFEAGVDYIDMATSLSEPHPTDPFNLPACRSPTTSSRSTTDGTPLAAWPSWAWAWTRG